MLESRNTPESPRYRRNTVFGAAALFRTWTIMHVLFWGLGFLLFPDLMNVVASTGRSLLTSRKGNVCYTSVVCRFANLHTCFYSGALFCNRETE